MSAPYIDYCLEFRKFLGNNGWPGPREFWKDVNAEMRAGGSRGFSESAAWHAFYGWKTLPDNVTLFCMQRHGFKPNYLYVEERKNAQGIHLKRNQLSLPGMREIKEARRLRR